MVLTSHRCPEGSAAFGYSRAQVVNRNRQLSQLSPVSTCRAVLAEAYGTQRCLE